MAIRGKTNLFLVLAFCLCGPPDSNASSQVPAPQQQGPIALVGGTIHPVSSGVIQGGTILFDRGKIIALGAAVEIPADAAVEDLTGRHVYPGLIDANALTGLVEVFAVRATHDLRETGRINPNVRAERAVNPGSEHIPVTRANGIAAACVLPSGGLISGMGALIELDGWTWEDMTLKAPLCMMLNWPDMRGNTGFATVKDLEERGKKIKEEIEEIEKVFREARAYRAAVRAAGARAAPFHEQDIRWEAMLPVLEGKLPVWVRANSLQQIEASVEWAEREKVKMVLVGGADSHLAAELLKARGIPVIVTPVHRLPRRRHSDYDEPFRLPARLFRAGVDFCIAGSPAFGNDRNLAYHAATAAAFGLPGEEALKAITLYAARILGVADRLGSLDKGKDATLIVTDGDPLEVTTRVEKLFIQGRDIDLDNKQKTLYRKYREKYRRLRGK